MKTQYVDFVGALLLFGTNRVHWGGQEVMGHKKNAIRDLATKMVITAKTEDTQKVKYVDFLVICI